MRGKSFVPIDGKLFCPACDEWQNEILFRAKEKALIRGWRYRPYCKEHLNARTREVYFVNVEKRERKLEKGRMWVKNNKDKVRVSRVKWEKANPGLARTRLRCEAILAYGGRCKCCGESAPEFLTLDHVNNDGYIERKLFPNTYAKAKREGWPSQYQLLCCNCNCAKGWYGLCPHEIVRQNQGKESSTLNLRGMAKVFEE